MMALPVLTDEQRSANLRKAAQARKERRALLDDVASGRVGIADVLASDDQTARRTPVSKLLCALPGVGHTKALKILNDAGLEETRGGNPVRVSRLGANQKRALIDAIDRYAS